MIAIYVAMSVHLILGYVVHRLEIKCNLILHIKLLNVSNLQYYFQS